MITRTKNKTKHIIKGSVRRVRAVIVARRAFIYHLDNPKGRVAQKEVTVDGWIIPQKTGLKVRDVRVTNGDKIYSAKFGIRRPDVVRSHPEYNKQDALYSGFSVEIELKEEDIIIEVDFGKGHKKLRNLKSVYSEELLVADYYNASLANTMSEHQNLLANKKALYYEPASKGTFTRGKYDPRLVAFYLPQFHPIAENNEVWGEGFTEWTNVASATPRFIGHQQPLLPADLGFYDLRLEDNIKKQIDLAKKYGVYGFCFYYYWFSGKQILDKPLDSFLSHKDWDFNFTICWANENWTKRWDGRDKDVIIAQKYRKEDPLKFIQDVEHILNDPRYINEEGKPVLIVYRASELKDPAMYAKVWREYFRKKHGKELQLVSVLSFEEQDPREYGFDAALDFAPLSVFFKQDAFEKKKLPYIGVAKKLIDPDFQGITMDYRKVALNKKLDKSFDYPSYRSVMPSWDNDARKKGKGFVYQNANPDIYATWLDRIISIEEKNKKGSLVFVNAWNEWAEGTMLEPSSHLGHSVLKRTAEVLAKHSSVKSNIDEFPQFEINKKADLAVIIHLYYPERWDQIKQKLDNLKDHTYDLFITINIKDKDMIPELQEFKDNTKVIVVPNRGRDVLPFLHLTKRLDSHGYKNILKLHTKKSKHRGDGDEWFDDLITKLLPSIEGVNSIIRTLDQEDTIIGPAGHVISLNNYLGSNEPHMINILSQTHNLSSAKRLFRNKSDHAYVAGTMFWANINSIKPLIDIQMIPEDFEYERGQIDGTMAHSLERVLSLLPILEGNQIYQSDSKGLKKVEDQDIVMKYPFAP